MTNEINRMTKVFLNEEMKRFEDLTREQKHIILDNCCDGICEMLITDVWEKKETCGIHYKGIYRTKPKEYKKLDIPWEVIDEKWKWAAMDEDRELFLFEEKPTWKNNLWIDYSEDGECIQLYNILKLDTTDIVAEYSLTKRPEGV